MVEEVRRQIREHPGILNGTEEPDYKACIAISTKASLTEMIIPGLLVRKFLSLGRLDSFVYWIRFRPNNARWVPPWSNCQWCPTSYFCSQHWWRLGQC